MICEYCKQRHANVTVTQIQNGQKIERHYCEVCAAQFHPFQFEASEEPASLQQLISNWFNFTPSAKKESAGAVTQVTKSCPTCGFTYRDFLQKGKFGCEHCYETFQQHLPNLLQRIQAGTKHVGYVEEERTAQKMEQEIADLRKQMQSAISEERFEDAAKIRDEIRVLESNRNHKGEDKA
jgi:protein arginine kinase activator